MGRHSNTANDLKSNGAWAKVGRKKYQHVNGAVVEYDCNHFGWRVNGGQLFAALWVAIAAVENKTSEAA